ncbi:MAG: hypothetical protein CYG60_23075 [Actinobacteria bacterium]|nr:MAG: hypothetical protein CYG60_23075 [Actinomycetota bacterium]
MRQIGKEQAAVGRHRELQGALRGEAHVAADVPAVALLADLIACAPVVALERLAWFRISDLPLVANGAPPAGLATARAVVSC